MAKTPTRSKVELNALTDEQKDLLAEQVAMGIANLTSQKDIAEELGLNLRQLRGIIKSKRCQDKINDLQEYTRQQAKASISARAKELMSKAYTALDLALEKGSVEGVKLVFKTLGLLEEQQEEKGDTNLTVVLPGQREVKDVENQSD